MTKERKAAAIAVQKARRAGLLVRQPCVICGHVRPDRQADAHHDDYSRPLDVVWLCRYHHTMLHREGFASSAELIAHCERVAA
jgi:hypothetical protein